MQYRTLGRTGIKVSPYALGAMMFGGAIGNPDHDNSIAIIHKALDTGINVIDTADAQGDSEDAVGRDRLGRHRLQHTRPGLRAPSPQRSNLRHRPVAERSVA